MVGYPDAEIDLLLNATSLGLRANDPLPLDTSAFPLCQALAVYDMIYRPAETPLLAAAAAARAREPERFRQCGSSMLWR